MGLRFYRRVRIAPGLALNLSASGASLSIGGRGGRVTFGRKGTRYTVGLPGTGLYVTEQTPRKPSAPQPIPQRDPIDRLRMGWLRRALTPPDEVAFVDALRAYASGDQEQALRTLGKCGDLADSHYLAGLILMNTGDLVGAAARLESARSTPALGRLYQRWDAAPVVHLDITPEIVVRVFPDTRGISLLLIELYQELGRFDEAQKQLVALLNDTPGDPVVRLSAAELLVDMSDRDEGVRREALELVLRLTDPGENADDFDNALLLYRSRALRRLGLLEGAKDVLTAALRRRKNRSQHLMLELHYERALVYEAMGKEKQARKELEVIYSEDPGFRDVAERLGIRAG